MRKSPAQRVEEYRTKAAQIEERERRKLLGKSPQWMATRRAMANMETAMEVLMELETDDALTPHATALNAAHRILFDCRAAEID